MTACLQIRPKDLWRRLVDSVSNTKGHETHERASKTSWISEQIQEIISQLCYFHLICPAAHLPGKIQRINWSPRFQNHPCDTEEIKLLLAVVYSPRCVSMWILLWFKKTHCSRHMLLLARSTKPPFRLPAVVFSFLATDFSYVQLCSTSDFADSCMSQLKIYGLMLWKSFVSYPRALLNWTNRTQNGRKCSCKRKCSH